MEVGEDGRLKRHARIRKNLAGSSERPRLCVFRSHAHIYTQIVDDVNGTTLAGASTLSPQLSGDVKGKSKTDASREVGKLIAQRAGEKGIKKVAFDRGGYRYHGRLKALAEGAREGGLEF
ncbi:50S ribosomal protein L18 [Candidatus Eisenbacteria bacterium]|uniref:Large ribosomal subunit protein uL18 n=1 Tax=Eiseniibacteriota bacterium TaxID=2212470 RepID=A0ABV6YKW9_UNCEI